MASNTVRVTVDADTKGFVEGFKKAVKSPESFGVAVGTMAGNLAFDLGRRALTAIKDFVGASLTAFSDLNESLNALNVVYGENAEGIKSLGEDAARSLGQSNAEFNSFAVSIGAFVEQIAGDTGDTVGVVDELSTRIADFASVMNLDFGEAAERFRSGLAGQSEPLRQFGIDVSDARIKQQAMTDGIWDGVGAMTEGEKVQARYNAIMEQTDKTAGDFANTSDDVANKQRILNAELENQQALLGQALLPLQNTWLEIQKDALPIIAELALEVADLTGALTDAEIVLKEWEIAEGRSVETAKDVIEAISAIDDSLGEVPEAWQNAIVGTEAWRDMLLEVVAAGTLTTDELVNLRDELHLLERQGKLTAEQLAEYTAAVEDQIVADVNAQRAAGQHRGALDDAAGAQANLGEETEDTTDKIVDQMEAIRELTDRQRAAVDPVFAYMQATNDLADAEERLTELENENKEGTPEYLKAAEDKARANLDIRDSVAAIGEEGVPAAVTALRSLGVPQSVIDKFQTDKARIEEIFRNLVLRVGVSAPSLFPTRPESGGIGWKTTTSTYYQKGGVATGPAPTGVFGEAGTEAILPLEDQRGIDFMAAALRKAGVGGGINITVYAGMGTNGHDVGEQIVQEIEKARRRGVAV